MRTTTRPTTDAEEVLAGIGRGAEPLLGDNALRATLEETPAQ